MLVSLFVSHYFVFSSMFFFAFRVSTSSGDIFALLYSLSICYGSFVIIWYDGEAVAFVQNIFRFLTAQVCEWTTHHAEPSFSA